MGQAAPATAEDMLLKEWAECRVTIGRMDTILVDLRKVGFAFITALLTASSFLTLLGVQADPTKALAIPEGERAAAFVSIMVLTTALFAVDSYYQILLSGAVERALDLEARSNPQIRLTKYISINIQRTGATVVTLFLYVTILATAGFLGLLAVSTTLTTTGNPPVATYQYLGPWNDWSLLIAWIGGGLLAFMLGYWTFIALRIGLHRHKKTRQWPGDERAGHKA